MINRSGQNATYHWLPRNGKPTKVLDMLFQLILKAMAYLPVYIAVVVTITLLVILCGVPYVGGNG